MAERYNTITIESRGPVDWLTLNRPEAMNAISLEMVREGSLEIRQEGAFQPLYMRRGPGRGNQEVQEGPGDD